MKKTPLALLCAAAFSIPAQSVFAQQTNDDDIEVLEVRGQHTEDASSLLRNGIELDEIARSVQILSEDFIQEVKPKSLEYVLAYTSNAGFLGSSDGRQSSFTMRGFQNPPVLIDGFRVSEWGGVAEPELYGLDQVEILKGPDSILYGESNPGGIINMRAKRPTRNADSEIMLDIGNYGYVSPRIDLNGEFSDNALFRLVGLYTYEDTYRDYDNPNKRMYIAPSVKLDFGDATTVTLFAEITKDDNHADFGNVIDADGNFVGPISQVTNGQEDTFERHLYNYGIDVTHQLNESWQVNGRARVLDSGYEYSLLWLPYTYDVDSNTVIRVPANQLNWTDENAFQLSMSGDFDLGSMRNRLVVGTDYRLTDNEYGGGWDPSVLSFLNWAEPDYDADVKPPFENLGLYGGTDEATRLGIFAQDYLNITDDLIVSVGLRYDDVERDLDGEDQDLSNTSFQTGVTYHINTDLTFYASYSESFSPNTETDKFFNLLDPEIGEGFEAGLKGNFSERISFTLAAFSIEKSNVAVTDPTAAETGTNPFGVRAAGKQKATGAEFDINWAVNDQLSIFANLGFSDTEELDFNENDTLVKVGKVIGAPESTASLWANYVFPVASGELTIGGGLQYTGERYIAANFTTDSHTLANVYARYNYENWQFQLNIQNAFDEIYVAEAYSAPSGRGVRSGDPRGIVGSIAYRF